VKTIGNIEAGRTVPRLSTVRLLADALGLDGAERHRFCALAATGESDGPGSRPRRVPAHLPMDVDGFTGRTAELDALGTIAAAADRQPTALLIIAIDGTAGIGKTALAVHWAHRVAERFPDGQLYVNLRGYDADQLVTPAGALARFLAALGVASQDIPLEIEERAARYRTEMAGRRMLVVLDNARTVEQVRPLLPGTPSCAVVVTSRDSLAGLVAVHGAHRVDLDLLPSADAVALLRRLIGPRVDAEPDAAVTLAAQCAHLPLALRVAAELAVARPTTPLAELAAELADQQRRLDLLDAGGDSRAAVATVFSWSIRNVPPEVALTFRHLGLHPGPDVDAYATAALADTGLPLARRTLDRLARAHLVHSVGGGRYGMHDLLHAYATQLSGTEDTDVERRAAATRLFDYYLATAAAAMDRLYPAEAHRRPRVTPPTTPTRDLADPETARRWLDAERPCLVAVAARTAANGWPVHTVRLSTLLFRYLDGGHHADALTIHGHAHDAARQVGDRAGQAQALLGLGSAYLQLGRHESAANHHEQALALFRRIGDRTGEARALGNLGLVLVLLGRYPQGAERYKQALTLYRQTGDRTGEARTMNNLGNVQERLGRYPAAAERYEQALTLYRRLGDRTGEAYALINLGNVQERLGHYPVAAERYDQALALCRRLGNRYGEAYVLSGLGTLYIRLGRPKDAAEQVEQALRLFRDSGNRNGEARALNALGEASQAAGQHADALANHTAALTIATDTGDRDEQARAHTGLGHAHRSLGQRDPARQHYERALALCTDLGSPDADGVRAHLIALAQPPGDQQDQ
jgi:tetratricopeptide (TPR) repeat protein